MLNRFKRIAKENGPENISFMIIMVGKFFCTSYTMDVTDPYYTRIEYMKNAKIADIWIEGKHTELTDEIIISNILTTSEIIKMLECEYKSGREAGENLTLYNMQKFMADSRKEKSG